MWFRIFKVFVFLAFILVFYVTAQKISPELKAKIEKGGTANIFISFGKTEPVLAATKTQRSGKSLVDNVNNLRSSLLNLANADQAGIINMLKTQRSSTPQTTFETMWLSNRLYIRDANFNLVKQISTSPNVTLITEEATSTIDETVSEPIETKSGADNGPEDYTYGLKKIQAPEAWEVLGGQEKAGEGVVVGVADSGCNVEHEAIKDNFYGGEYGYYAPYKGEQDENMLLHGTHVTGTIVGKKGIGVAPAAKHMQCQMCLKSQCREFGLEKCLQFFICPFKADGSDSDCSKRVHVINMSLQNLPDTIEPALNAAMTAGIILVSVAGNHGPLCRTIGYPGLLNQVITTGSTDKFDNLAQTSGLGPNLRPGGRIKPDVVGPGVNVLSANHDTSKFKYILMNGTSMAAPHLTGLVALLLTRDKTLTQEQVRELIVQNADQNVNYKLFSRWCDPPSTPKDSVLNSSFGFGRFNALKAINAQTAILAVKM